MVRNKYFVGVSIRAKIGEVGAHLVRVPQRREREHLIDVLTLRSLPHLLDLGITEGTILSSKEDFDEATPTPLEAHSSLLRLGGDDVDSGDHVGLSELLRRHESLTVDAHRLLQALRSEVRGEPEGQAQHRRELCPE